MTYRENYTPEPQGRRRQWRRALQWVALVLLMALIGALAAN